MPHRNDSRSQQRRKRDRVVGRECADRIRSALKARSFAEISRATGFCAETVRRYLLSGTPSLGFIRAVCDAYQLDARWLICGERELTPTHVLNEMMTVSSSDLVREIERRLGAVSEAAERAAQILEVKPSQS